MEFKDNRYQLTNYERLQRANEDLQRYVDWEKNQKYRDDAALDNKMCQGVLNLIKANLNSQIYNKCGTCPLRELCGLSEFRKHTNFYCHEDYEVPTCKEVMQNYVNREYQIYGRT